jgi:hypothetical protein
VRRDGQPAQGIDAQGLAFDAAQAAGEQAAVCGLRQQIQAAFQQIVQAVSSGQKPGARETGAPGAAARVIQIDESDMTPAQAAFL